MSIYREHLMRQVECTLAPPGLTACVHQLIWVVELLYGSLAIEGTSDVSGNPGDVLVCYSMFAEGALGLQQTCSFHCARPLERQAGCGPCLLPVSARKTERSLSGSDRG